MSDLLQFSLTWFAACVLVFIPLAGLWWFVATTDARAMRRAQKTLGPRITVRPMTPEETKQFDASRAVR